MGDFYGQQPSRSQFDEYLLGAAGLQNGQHVVPNGFIPPDSNNLMGYSQAHMRFNQGMTFPGQHSGAGMLSQPWQGFASSGSFSAAPQMDGDFSNDSIVLMDPQNDPMLGPIDGRSNGVSSFSSPLKTPTRETLNTGSPFRTPSFPHEMLHLGLSPSTSRIATTPGASTQRPPQEPIKIVSIPRPLPSVPVAGRIQEAKSLPSIDLPPKATIIVPPPSSSFSSSPNIQKPTKPIVEKPRARKATVIPAARPVGVGQGKPTTLQSGVRRLRKMLDMSKQKSIECMECRKFLRVAGIEAHVYTHSNDPLFLCRFCGFYTTSSSSATNHASAAHKKTAFEAIDDRRSLLDQELAQSLKILFRVNLPVMENESQSPKPPNREEPVQDVPLPTTFTVPPPVIPMESPRVVKSSVPKFDKTRKVQEAFKTAVKPAWMLLPEPATNEAPSPSVLPPSDLLDYSIENFPELAAMDAAPGATPTKIRPSKPEIRSPIQVPKIRSSKHPVQDPGPSNAPPRLKKLKINFGTGNKREQTSISMGEVAPADPVHTSVHQSLMAAAEKFNSQRLQENTELRTRSLVLVHKYRFRLAEKKTRVDTVQRLKRFYSNRKRCKNPERRPRKNTQRRSHLNIRILRALWYPPYQLRRMKHLGVLLEAFEISASRKQEWTFPCRLCGVRVKALSRPLMHHVLSRHCDNEYKHGESLEPKEWDKEQQFLIRILLFCFRLS